MIWINKQSTVDQIAFKRETIMNESTQPSAATMAYRYHEFNNTTISTSILLANDHDIAYLSSIKKQQAFTLIEVIITIAFIAIITSIATPYVLTQLAAMEAKRIRYDISNTLSIAKAESLIHRQNLLVCLSDDNSTCDKNSNSALLLFEDSNDNKSFDAKVDVLLTVQRLDPKYGTLHLRAGGRHHIKFFGDTGTPRGHFGHIKYCPSSTYNTAKYQVSFNNIGIIKYKPNSSHPTDCD